MPTDSLTLWSPQLRNRRIVDVYLPATYAAGRRRYPVVYLHDGQNLSNPATAFAGTWQLEAALDRLARGGLDVIAVGIHHAGEARIAEYSPFRDPRLGGGAGTRYVRFLLDTIKPRIDARYRTRRDRASTAVAGSSMGGLISLYAFFAPPRAFGGVAALSPSIWFGERRILDFVERAGAPRGRIYVDVGTAEGTETVRDTRALTRLLRQKGYAQNRSLRYVEAAGHRHREADWAARLPQALEFLFGGQ